MKRYKDMAELMQNYCKHLAKLESEGGNDNKADPLDSANENMFWNEKNLKGDDRKLVRNLSTPERPLQASVVQAILDSYLFRTLPKGQALKDQQNLCEKFVQEGNPKKIKEGDPIFDTMSQIYDYTRFVAVSQVLRVFEEALKDVGRRTAGVGKLDSNITDRAAQLVYEVAQVDDIYAALNANLLDWNDFIEEKIFAKRAAEIGHHGAGLTSTGTGGRSDAAQ